MSVEFNEVTEITNICDLMKVNDIDFDWRLENQYGDSLLHRAVYENQFELVKFLVEQKNISVDVENNRLWTPFHICCKYGNIEIVKYLLEKKCNIYKKNVFGDDGFSIALHNEEYNVVKELMAGGYEVLGYLHGESFIEYEEKINKKQSLMRKYGVDMSFIVGGLVKYILESGDLSIIKVIFQYFFKIKDFSNIFEFFDRFFEYRSMIDKYRYIAKDFFTEMSNCLKNEKINIFYFAPFFRIDNLEFWNIFERNIIFDLTEEGDFAFFLSESDICCELFDFLGVNGVDCNVLFKYCCDEEFFVDVRILECKFLDMKKSLNVITNICDDDLKNEYLEKYNYLKNKKNDFI